MEPYDPKKERPRICKHGMKKQFQFEHPMIPTGVYLYVYTCLTKDCDTMYFREDDYRKKE